VEQRRVAVGDPLRDLLVAGPRGVLDEQGRLPGARRGLLGGEDDVVVGAVEFHRLAGLGRDRGTGRRRDAHREEDPRGQPEQPREVSDRPAMVAVGGGDQLDGRAAGRGRAELVQRQRPAVRAVPLRQRPGDRVRRPQHLERRQPEPGRLLLDEHAAHAQLPRHPGHRHQPRYRVPWQRPVKAGHPRDPLRPPVTSARVAVRVSPRARHAALTPSAQPPAMGLSYWRMPRRDEVPWLS
jgi:hypothetical protein